jgi:hypothetical protein
MTLKGWGELSVKPVLYILITPFALAWVVCNTLIGWSLNVLITLVMLVYLLWCAMNTPFSWLIDWWRFPDYESPLEKFQVLVRLRNKYRVEKAARRAGDPPYKPYLDD